MFHILILLENIMLINKWMYRKKFWIEKNEFNKKLITKQPQENNVLKNAI